MNVAANLSRHRLPLPTCGFLTFWKHRQNVRLMPKALAPVYESLTLLQSVSLPGEAAAMLDDVWSAQYLVPGPIVGCAGPLIAFESSSEATYSHAVFFRFGRECTRSTFQQHPIVIDIIGNKAGPLCDSMMTFNFEGAVPNELESIFRRGTDWEVGVECILGLVGRDDDQTEEEIIEFLSLTQQLASSSAFGAVQATFGPCTEVIIHKGGSSAMVLEKPAYILSLRFQEIDQLEGFLRCPPIASMIECNDESAPIRVIWQGTLEINPAANSETSPQRGLSSS